MQKKLLVNTRVNAATGEKELLESRELYEDETVSWSVVENPPEIVYEPGKTKRYAYDAAGSLIVITEDAPVSAQDALRNQINALDATLQELLLEVIPSLQGGGGGN